MSGRLVDEHAGILIRSKGYAGDCLIRSKCAPEIVTDMELETVAAHVAIDDFATLVRGERSTAPSQKDQGERQGWRIAR